MSRDSIKDPGNKSFFMGGLLQKSSNKKQVEKLKKYLMQAKEELGLRLHKM